MIKTCNARLAAPNEASLRCETKPNSPRRTKPIALRNEAKPPRRTKPIAARNEAKPPRRTKPIALRNEAKLTAPNEANRATKRSQTAAPNEADPRETKPNSRAGASSRILHSLPGYQAVQPCPMNDPECNDSGLGSLPSSTTPIDPGQILATLCSRKDGNTSVPSNTKPMVICVRWKKIDDPIFRRSYANDG